MTEDKVNCLLDFIPVIFHLSWLTVVMLPEFMEVILVLGFQKSYVTGCVHVAELRVATAVRRVILALIVN